MCLCICFHQLLDEASERIILGSRLQELQSTIRNYFVHFFFLLPFGFIFCLWAVHIWDSWPPSTMDLNLEHSLIGYSHKSCVTFTPVHLTGLIVGFVASLVSPSLCWKACIVTEDGWFSFHIPVFLGASIVLGSYLDSKMPPYSIHLSQYSLPPRHIHYSSCSHSHLSPIYPEILFHFPFPRRLVHLYLGCPCYLVSLCSVKGSAECTWASVRGSAEGTCATLRGSTEGICASQWGDPSSPALTTVLIYCINIVSITFLMLHLEVRQFRLSRSNLFNGNVATLHGF